MTLRRDLESCLRVPYPYIVLSSFEEDRAKSLVREVAARVGLPMAVHAVTDHGSRDGRGAFLDILEHVARPDAAAVSLLLDAHPYLDDPVVVRALRDLRATLVAARRSVVLLGPVVRVPVELDKELTILELPLPTDDELRVVLRSVFEERGVDLPSAGLMEAAARAARGLTADEAARTFARLALEGGLESEDGLVRIAAEKRRILKRSELLEIVEDSPGLDDVGGAQELKRWLLGRVDAFGDEARAFGLPQPRGLLLVGVQGCGKSLTAKAIARTWRLPLARLDLGQLFGQGQSAEDNLRRVLRMAEAMAPLILWIDEIDKSFAGVGGGGGQSLNRVFGSFITWMQEKSQPVFVVATANGVQDLPPDLLRKGRFDELFFVDLPSRQERESIFRIHLRARGRDPQQFDPAALADRAEHFSGAEIEQAVVSALYDAFAERRELLQTDLLRAVSETTPLYATAEEPIKRLREWARTRTRQASSGSRLMDLFRPGPPPRKM